VKVTVIALWAKDIAAGVVECDGYGAIAIGGKGVFGCASMTRIRSPLAFFKFYV
jgi:hypothetical protein